MIDLSEYSDKFGSDSRSIKYYFKELLKIYY